MSFRTKIVLLGVFIALLTMLSLMGDVYLQSERYNQDAQKKVEAVTDANLKNVIQGTYNMIKAQGESVQQQVDTDLRVAALVMREHGMVYRDQETISWKAINQYTLATTDITLPKLHIGNSSLEQNTDISRKTPVIDEITGLVGGAATMFQRMNAAGDMLRVATNVRDQAGNRAIGTFIPAINPDRQANPVIAAILKGQTYHGAAYVVDAWYISAYQPILDETGQIIGMLFVGVKQDDIASIRQAINEGKFGLSGQTYILSGSGDHRGTYILSPGGALDGQSALGIRDADGKFPIETILNEAQSLGNNEVNEVRFREAAGGNTAPRWKIDYVMYYKPWDWVIVSEVYQDELTQYQSALSGGRNRMILSSSLVGLAIALIAGGVSFLVTRNIVRPLRHLSETAASIADGNLDLSAKVYHKDEIGRLAQSFNHMTARLRSLLQVEQRERQHLQDTVNRYALHLERVTQGDFSEQVKIEGKQEGNNPLIQLGLHLNQMTASLLTMIRQIHDAAQDLSAASTEILSATVQQVLSASQQSSAVLQTTTTADEVKTVTERNSQSLEAVADAAQRTVAESRVGRQAVQETVVSMNQIEKRMQSIAENIQVLSRQVRQIDQIINTVNDIASQSNMLALNAAVEAARSGEHGQGFAVVAGEVRQLSEQSKQATVKIKTLLTEIQKAIRSTSLAIDDGAKGVEDGMKLAARSGETIERLTRAIEQSAQVAGEVVAGGYQQQERIEQIARAMHAIQQTTLQGMASTRQTETSAKDLNTLALKLAATVEQYSAKN